MQFELKNVHVNLKILTLENGNINQSSLRRVGNTDVFFSWLAAYGVLQHIGIIIKSGFHV